MGPDYSAEVQILKRLDEATLENMLGSTIVRAVKQAYDINTTSVLAELVAVRYSYALLEDKGRRRSIIDVLDDDVISNFKNKIGSEVSIYDYFSSGYSEQKSREFVDLLGFPENHISTKVEDHRMETELVQPAFGDTLISKGFLHPYQKAVKDLILLALKSPGNRCMVQMPTGAGKTYTALETAVDILRRPDQKRFVVWLVNRNELAEQALNSFRDLWASKGDRPLKICRLFGQFCPNFQEFDDGAFVFASYDVLSNILDNSNDQRRQSIFHLIQNTEYLIVDEAHAAVAYTYEKCIYAFTESTRTFIVGLSATPFRNDFESGEELKHLFTNNLISIARNGAAVENPIAYLQGEGYLAKINFETLETKIKIDGGNEQQVLKKLAEDPVRNETITLQMSNCVDRQEKVIVFACTKDHAVALKVLGDKAGLRSAVIIGEVPLSERLKIFESFESGEIDVLINHEILSTGIDLPSVNALIISRPVKSAIQYSQMVGRAFRGPKNGGNPENRVINIKDNLRTFANLDRLYESFAGAWGD